MLKAYESGGMTSESFHLRICEMTGLECDFERFADDWRHIFWANEPVHRLIDGLRGLGYTLVLGSNTNPLHAAHFREQFAETSSATSTGWSSPIEVGHVKPATEFYLACATAAARPPGESVFIDDLAENVQGAERGGANRRSLPDSPASVGRSPQLRRGDPRRFAGLRSAAAGDFAGKSPRVRRH